MGLQRVTRVCRRFVPQFVDEDPFVDGRAVGQGEVGQQDPLLITPNGFDVPVFGDTNRPEHPNFDDDCGLLNLRPRRLRVSRITRAFTRFGLAPPRLGPLWEVRLAVA